MSGVVCAVYEELDAFAAGEDLLHVLGHDVLDACEFGLRLTDGVRVWALVKVAYECDQRLVVSLGILHSAQCIRVESVAVSSRRSGARGERYLFLEFRQKGKRHAPPRISRGYGEIHGAAARDDVKEPVLECIRELAGVGHFVENRLGRGLASAVSIVRARARARA